MAAPTTIYARPGLPFTRRVRVVGGKNVWGDLAEVEARMHIRTSEDPTSTLKYDFTPHLDVAFDVNDIVIDWSLTGLETRDLKGGYFDLVLSDVGPEDARALSVLYGELALDPIITTNEGPV